MLAQRISHRIIPLAVMCAAVTGMATSAASGETIDISWQTVTKLVAEEGHTVTREGRAEFTNGETAYYRLEAVLGPQSSWSGGTSTADAVYRFNDGSNFTIRLVLIWNSLRQVGAGLFSNGTGRFAGIRGSATGSGDGLSEMLWRGVYDLPKK
jgi:hypothetical protein